MGVVLTAGADSALRYARCHRRLTIRRLISLLRFPTVSADPRRAEDMTACAVWLARLLRRIGLHDVDIQPGRIAPIVTASWHGQPGRPTVLVYGHYDVQPVGPPGAWATDPFAPIARGPHLYARGASDNKGQLMAHLTAIDAWLATTGALPINLQLILDGEEEVGSPTLLATARNNSQPVADVAVVSDTGMLGLGIPVLTTGLRGHLGARIEISGPTKDLHAGTFGGALVNPADVLAGLIASLRDGAGRIAIAGFYDQVHDISVPERRTLARNGPSDTVMLTLAGVAHGHGEPGFSAFERSTRRPAVVVTNLQTSGHGRTVVPAWAAADLSVRLVAGQEVPHIAQLLRRHLAQRIPPAVRSTLVFRKHCPPYTLNKHSPFVRAVRSACCEVFGRAPVLLPSGGSIPFINTVASRQKMDAVLLGFGLPDDARHAANERMHVCSLFRGTDTCIRLYRHLGDG
jgi:acetylornithine deacetylase/succinyl-diaminopimelate desuccinylase-like protein